MRYGDVRHSGVLCTLTVPHPLEKGDTRKGAFLSKTKLLQDKQGDSVIRS
jgi:hypothetical protein